MRLDGYVLVSVGACLCAVGLVAGHQGAADATFSGCIMIAGTGLFMLIRHRAPFRDPGAWFTSKPLAHAAAGRAQCSRSWLIGGVLAETGLLSVMAVGLSYLSGFWLTYVDMGVWALGVGAIKAGPGSMAISRKEVSSGTRYLVSRRPVRGLVELTAEEMGSVPLSDTGKHPVRADDLRETLHA
jgi:hypothetical protein